jgi:tetratricopeptide (TPR) repeat protein
MLMTASSLGYRPSTLTLMAILTRSAGETTRKFRAHIRDAESRFKRLLRTENNPDAFTLQGVLLLQEGRPESEQLLYYNRAIEAARSIPPPPSPTSDHPTPNNQTTPTTPRQPKWTYEATCHLRRGLILLKQGQTDQALASFQIVALELGLAEGYVELAKLLPTSAPERETYLLKAAQAGNFEACRLLALHLADKASDAALASDERVFAARMAQEWAQVDPDVSRREGVVEEVVERTGEVLGGRVWFRG